VPPIKGVTIHKIELESFRLPHLLRCFEAALRVRRLLRRLRPQVLHVHYIGWNAWVAALTGFRPLVLTAWGGDVLAELGAFDMLAQRLLTPFAIRAAALLTADATPLAEVLDRYRGHAPPALLIRFGADRERFHPQVPTEHLRQSLNLGDGPVVFSPRSFIPIYRIEVIIRAWPEVVSQIPEARLLLKSSVAEADYSASLRQLVSDLGIDSSVRFVGSTDYSQMPAFYNLASATVSVPFCDGLPATAMEALACGSPLVVSDLPWAKDVITHGQNGMVVPVDDPSTLAGVLLQLLRDQLLQREVVRGGLAYSAEFGDWHCEMTRMERAYETIVKPCAASEAKRWAVKIAVTAAVLGGHIS
jgi:glycosyltransferase involved in cell wall biosynthesis